MNRLKKTMMQLFTIRNKNGLKATITDYGGRVINIFTPDKSGHLDDIVLGYDNLEEYLTSNEKYYGAIIGRYGNRIGDAKFTLGEKTYLLDKNEGKNCLHGGLKGFHNILWHVVQFN